MSFILQMVNLGCAVWLVHNGNYAAATFAFGAFIVICFEELSNKIADATKGKQHDQ